MDVESLSADIERLFDRHPSTIGRDLKVSLRRVLVGGSLSPQAAAPVVLALAHAVHHAALIELAERWMATAGYEPEQIAEAREAPALLAMVNTYYSFRELLGSEGDEPVGLTMTATARPVLGKLPYERVALALSTLNKCAPCIRFHAAKLRQLGASQSEIHDMARLAAVVKGYAELP